MARKNYTTEQIKGKLRQAEVMVGQGRSVDKVVREIDVARTLITAGGRDTAE